MSAYETQPAIRGAVDALHSLGLQKIAAEELAVYDRAHAGMAKVANPLLALPAIGTAALRFLPVAARAIGGFFGRGAAAAGARAAAGAAPAQAAAGGFLRNAWANNKMMGLMGAAGGVFGGDPGSALVGGAGGLLGGMPGSFIAPMAYEALKRKAAPQPPPPATYGQ